MKKIFSDTAPQNTIDRLHRIVTGPPERTPTRKIIRLPRSFVSDISYLHSRDPQTVLRILDDALGTARVRAHNVIDLPTEASRIAAYKDWNERLDLIAAELDKIHHRDLENQWQHFRRGIRYLYLKVRRGNTPIPRSSGGCLAYFSQRAEHGKDFAGLADGVDRCPGVNEFASLEEAGIDTVRQRDACTR